KRIDLYRSSQVFCLPTYYRYEGQPISIIEAYASGCVVVTTDQGGIGDIFKNNKNGYEVEKESIEDLVDKLEKIIISDKNKNEEIGLFNNKLTINKYTEIDYVTNIDNIFDKV
ncbi:MAG: glycosyltransferase family 4 protein, partial [Planctomycetes bacterium]|nr:glycosyltransferase family 4 protein [Planctomycetota bacterium]